MSGERETQPDADGAIETSSAAKSVHSEKPIIMDVEASGFGQGSYPIEVGFAMADGSTHCRLIKPLEHWTHWNDEAQVLHGVERQQLFDYGWSAEDIAHWLNEILAGKTIYTDAWSHDMSWLGKLYHDVGITQNFELESLLVLLTPEQTETWDEAKIATAATLTQQRHRASADAFLIQQTFMHLDSLN